MSLITEITAVRALQRDLRDATVPSETARAIQYIQECLQSGTDTNGWHRVDWRSRGGGSSADRHGSGGGGGYRGGGGHRGGGNYRNFGSRGGGVGNSTTGGGFHINRNAPAGGAGTGNSTSNSTNNSITSTRLSNKYISRFKSSTENIDETILNTIILGKLNKFSIANYEDIKAFMCQILDSGETDFLKEFMKLVFQKAPTEEVFCPLYAKLLSELSEKYVMLLDEMVVLYREYMAIFLDIDESECSNYDEFVERTSQKKYRLGYSQFLAELVKEKVLNRDLLLETIRVIVGQVPKVAGNTCFTRIGEEYTECLSKIIGALVSSSDEMICKVCKIVQLEFSPVIQPFTVKCPENKLSMKARFALLDVYTILQRA